MQFLRFYKDNNCIVRGSEAITFMDGTASAVSVGARQEEGDGEDAGVCVPMMTMRGSITIR